MSDGTTEPLTLRVLAELLEWCFLWERLDPVTFRDIDEQGVREFAREGLQSRGLTV